MNSNCRLSIIVPVYNVEQWLVRCLDSLYNQEFDEDEFEVIIVNDGSPDKSLQLADAYALRHRNMVVVTRENGGLSAARNTGLEHAKGKYVWFVDSDDFVEPNSIKSVLEYAETNDLDAMGFLFQYTYDDGKKKSFDYRPKFPNVIFNGREFVCKTGFICSPWAMIYRREFLENNSLLFMEGILHEDQEFSPRVKYLAEKIAHTDKIVYNYSQRTGSIMKSNRSKERVSSFLQICDSLYQFILKNTITDKSSIDYFNKNIAFCFTQALSHYSQSGLQGINQFKSKPYYPLRTPTHFNKKQRVQLWMINHALWLYVTALRIKKNF